MKRQGRRGDVPALSAPNRPLGPSKGIPFARATSAGSRSASRHARSNGPKPRAMRVLCSRDDSVEPVSFASAGRKERWSVSASELN
jgi:hypothetical protein